MEKKFIFVKDVAALIRQGKTEMVLPGGTRFSPAARDLIREQGIQVSFTDAASVKKSEKAGPIGHQGDMLEKVEPSGQGLIAVVSSGRDIKGPVGKDAKKEPFFLIFDTKGRFIDIIKNPYTNGGDGSDLSIAELMAASQVSTMVAETFGSRLRAHLEAKKVLPFEISGRIPEAVDRVLKRKDSAG
jgi:predicted Fe-Mo cluster-binding NifX family protein